MKELSKEAQDILRMIMDMAGQKIEDKQIIQILEDGAGLESLGIGDEDQEAVEELHDYFRKKSAID
jgi:hypothetical protein